MTNVAKGKRRKILSGELDPARPDVKDRRGGRQAARAVLGWDRGGQSSELELCRSDGRVAHVNTPVRSRSLSFSPSRGLSSFPLPALSMPSSHLHMPLDMITVTGGGQSGGGNQAGAHF